MQKLGTLWVGDRLGEMERACLWSMRAQGHEVTLFSYRPLPDLPPGIAWRDAAEILPTSRILIYRDKRKPSPALHANLFRYAMLACSDLAWVDLDVVLLRPLPEGERLYGLEHPQSVNNAVLRLPRTSPVLADLRQFTPDTRGVAPHITGLRRAKYWLKTLGRGQPIEHWAWGSTGPKALTLYLRRHGELCHALPVEAFYPVSVQDHAQLLQPGRWDFADFPQQSFCVHLWGSRIRSTLRQDHHGAVPPGSFIDRLLARAGSAGFL